LRHFFSDTDSNRLAPSTFDAFDEACWVEEHSLSTDVMTVA
jgi:hypothetical protein